VRLKTERSRAEAAEDKVVALKALLGRAASALERHSPCCPNPLADDILVALAPDKGKQSDG